MENIKLTNQNTLIEKKLPHNLEAEQALIGSILINNDVIDEVASLVNPSKFFDPAHKKIFEVIENLNNKGMIANPITLKNFFQNEKGLDEVGGTDYLVKLTRFSSSSRQAIDYAKIIHEMYVKRELIFIAENISTDSQNDKSDKSGENIIENAEQSLFQLAERGNFSQSYLKFNKAIDQTIMMATEAVKSDQGIVGVPTGLKDLDEKLGGLHKSDLIILAIIGVLTSVISAFYYIRIIKIIYFDKPKKPFDETYDWGLKSSLILSSILVLIYFIYPSYLTNAISTIFIN